MGGAQTCWALQIDDQISGFQPSADCSGNSGDCNSDREVTHVKSNRKRATGTRLRTLLEKTFVLFTIINVLFFLIYCYKHSEVLFARFSADSCHLWCDSLNSSLKFFLLLLLEFSCCYFLWMTCGSTLLWALLWASVGGYLCYSCAADTQLLRALKLTGTSRGRCGELQRKKQGGAPLICMTPPPSYFWMRSQQQPLGNTVSG